MPLQYSGGFPVGYIKAYSQSGCKVLGLIQRGFWVVIVGFSRFYFQLHLENVGNIGLLGVVLLFLWYIYVLVRKFVLKY